MQALAFLIGIFCFTVFSVSARADWILPIVGHIHEAPVGHPHVQLNSFLKVLELPNVEKSLDDQSGQEERILVGGKISLDYNILFLDLTENERLAVGHGFGFFTANRSQKILVEKNQDPVNVLLDTAQKALVCDFHSWAKLLKGIAKEDAIIVKIRGSSIVKDLLSKDYFLSTCKP